MADIGIRVVVLGVGEARRSLGAVRSDLSGVEKEIRTLSKTSITLGRDLTRLGSTIAGVGRTMTLTLTTPILLAGAGLVQAGIEFEDTFAGVTKTVDGLSVGFEEAVEQSDEYKASLLALQQANIALGIGHVDTAMALDVYIASMTDADKEAIYLSDSFGELTDAGEQFREDIRKLALEIPISVNELNKLAQAGGQVGIPLGENGEVLLAFTEIVAKLGVATNITSEQAALDIARFANIYGVEAENMIEWTESFAAALVELGNTTAAQESEILSLAKRIASAGALSEMTEAEVLALAASLVEVGVASERGGTAVRRMLTEMSLAVATGSDELALFAQVVGVTEDEFSDLFNRDAASAIELFALGFNRMWEEGTLTEDMLKDMGLSGVRALEVMQLLGLTVDNLRENTGRANNEWTKQNALQEEAAKRFRTVKSQIQILKNTFTELGIEIFDLYSDNIQNLISSLSNLIAKFSGLDDDTKRTILRFVALAAAAGPVLIVIGLTIQKIGILITSFGSIISIVSNVIGIMSGLGLAMLPLVGIVGAVALAFSTDFLGIRTFVQDVYNAFVQWHIPDQVKDIANSLISGDIIGAVEQFKGIFEDIGNALSSEITYDEETGLFAFGQESPLAKFKRALSEGLLEIETAVKDSGIIDTLENLYLGVEGFVTNFTQTLDTEALKQAAINVAIALAAVAFGVGQIVQAGVDQFSEMLPGLGKALADVLNIIATIDTDNLAKAVGFLIILSLPTLITGLATLTLTVVGLSLAFVALALPLILIGGIAAAFATDFGGISTAVDQVSSSLEEGDVAGILDGILDTITAIPLGIAEWIGAALGIDVPNGMKAWKKVGEAIIEIIKWLADNTGSLIGAIIIPTPAGLDTLYNTLKEMVGFISTITGFDPGSGPNVGSTLTSGEATSGSGQANARGMYNDFVMEGLSPEAAARAVETATGWQPGSYARGGLMRGLGLVGERGPELAFAGSPTTIIPNTLTNRILSAFETESKIQSMLVQTLSAFGSGALGSTSNVYSPVFHGAPSRDTMRSNSDLYEQWIMAQQGI